MTYASIAALTQDNDFMLRVAACYALENGKDHPQSWAEENRWNMAAIPGFGDAYAYAITNNVDHPGLSELVITDPQILSAVQSLMVK